MSVDLDRDTLETLTGALRIMDDPFFFSTFNNAEDQELRERLRGLVETLATRLD